MFDKLHEYQINPTGNIDEKKAVQDDKQQDENEAINHLGSSQISQISSQSKFLCMHHVYIQSYRPCPFHLFITVHVYMYFLSLSLSSKIISIVLKT